MEKIVEGRKGEKDTQKIERMEGRKIYAIKRMIEEEDECKGQ